MADLQNDDAHELHRQRSRTQTILSVLSATFGRTRTTSSTVVLSRRLGLGSTVSLLIGIMIGTGIFVSPRGVLSYTGSYGASLVVWTLCGVVALMGALTFAELALMFPKSGGDHTYLQETYGDMLAYLHGWGAVAIVRPMSLAIVSIVLGEYIIYPYFSDMCYRDERMVRLHAATFIIFLVLVHGSGIKIISKLQIVFTSIKVFTLVLIIVNGFINIALGYTNYLDVDTSFSDTDTNAFAIGMAFYQGMFAYEGWNSLTYSMEEMKEPEKTLPRAIMIALPVITLLYVLVNISYYTILSPTMVLADDAIAMTFANYSTQGVGFLSGTLPFLVCCAAFGSANGLCYTYSRMSVALGREGHMPSIVGMVNPDTMSPNFALFLLAFLSCGMLLLPISLHHMIEFFTFAIWLTYLLISIAVLILRYKEPDHPRPFRVPLVLPIILTCLSFFFVIAPFFESLSNLDLLAALAAILGGLIFYFPFIHFKYQPPFMEHVTVFVQLFFYIVNTEYKPPDNFPIHRKGSGDKDSNNGSNSNGNNSDSGFNGSSNSNNRSDEGLDVIDEIL